MQPKVIPTNWSGSVARQAVIPAVGYEIATGVPRAQALVAGTLTLDRRSSPRYSAPNPPSPCLAAPAMLDWGRPRPSHHDVRRQCADWQRGRLHRAERHQPVWPSGADGLRQLHLPLCTRRHQAASIQPLDIATLKDTLHHAADTGGKAAYLDALAHGLSRADAFVSFSEPLEHRRPIWDRSPCCPERSGFNPAPAVKVAGRSPGWPHAGGRRRAPADATPVGSATTETPAGSPRPRRRRDR